MHQLIDELGDQEVAELHRIAAARRDLALANPSDPLDGVSDPERDRFHAVLRQAEAEFERGEGIPVQEAIRQLRRP